MSTPANPEVAARPILVLSNISKHFDGTQALNDVSFELRPGEVHALVGENGAGKSTLVKIITGVHQPDTGTIVLDGKHVVFNDPLESRQHQISAIYQEPTLFPDMTIAENIFAGNLPKRPPLGRIDWPRAYSESAHWLQTLGIDRDTHTRVRGMSIADQQMVEIAKSLALNAKVLIMDEPTSALTVQEANDLFAIIRRMRDAGTGIIFITHRLEEVFQVADRVTVLRDGHFVGTQNIDEVNRDQLITMMVGRTLNTLFPKSEVELGEVVLKVDGLSKLGTFWDISFELHRGEILGLAGLAGAQRSDLVKAIFGESPADRGTISIDGRPVRIRSEHDAMKLGLAYVPADRQNHGLILPMILTHNITLAILSEFTKLTWINQSNEEQKALASAEQMEVRAAGLWQEARQLSGGNQQKVVLAKWLATKPRILILHEPTRGIDVGTKAAVHLLMSQLAAQGMAILMVSSELPEIMGMSDRIIVMSEGHLTAEFSRAEATQEKIMAAMSHIVERNIV
jgi:rhamnose transport system ATP-binding protein